MILDNYFENIETQGLKELEASAKKEAEAKAEADEKARLDREIAKVEAESIYFDFDKSFVRQEYRPLLHEKAQFLIDNPKFHVRIEGNGEERPLSLGHNENS